MFIAKLVSENVPFTAIIIINLYVIVWTSIRGDNRVKIVHLLNIITLTKKKNIVASYSNNFFTNLIYFMQHVIALYLAHFFKNANTVSTTVSII